MLKHTPFYDFHVSAGARMVEFAGWEMPVVYRSIIDEHEQTRKSGSMFDVSHMGRIQFTGKDADHFPRQSADAQVSDQKVGQSRYSLVCNEAGGVLDDIIISRDTKNWIMVCNASNREKLVKHFTRVAPDAGLRFRHGRPDRSHRDGRDPGAEGDRAARRLLPGSIWRP